MVLCILRAHRVLALNANQVHVPLCLNPFHIPRVSCTHFFLILTPSRHINLCRTSLNGIVQLQGDMLWLLNKLNMMSYEKSFTIRQKRWRGVSESFKIHDILEIFQILRKIWKLIEYVMKKFPIVSTKLTLMHLHCNRLEVENAIVKEWKWRKNKKVLKFFSISFTSDIHSEATSFFWYALKCE